VRFRKRCYGRYYGREQKPVAQQVELGTPKHRLLQHLQAVDLSLDRAVTPTQQDASFDRLIVCAQPYGKAPQGRYTTATARASQ
jgi:hypothetical protein